MLPIYFQTFSPIINLSLGDDMHVSDDQKRWVVIGIAFNKLVQQIRPFVEQCLQAEYQSLRSSHNIHAQTAPGVLKKHPKNLKYENINGNSNHKRPSGKPDFSKFDYRVTSHVDLAKLYLQPFMAKFSAFDGKCDGSAVLLLLGDVPVFSPAIQASAKVLREHVRNEWPHCNFTDWDAPKFQSCFQEMQQLVQSIGLPTADETRLLLELNDWETKGFYCILNLVSVLRMLGLESLCFHGCMVTYKARADAGNFYRRDPMLPFSSWSLRVTNSFCEIKSDSP